jgi:hypothetical protein
MNKQDFIQAWNFMFGQKEFNGLEEIIIEKVVASFSPLEVATAMTTMSVLGYTGGSDDQPPMALMLDAIMNNGGEKKNAEK